MLHISAVSYGKNRDTNKQAQTSPLQKSRKFPVTKLTMEIERSLNYILHTLRNSNLHLSAQETPHSLYLSIRKKSLNLESAPPRLTTPSNIPGEKYAENYGRLEKESKLFEV